MSERVYAFRLWVDHVVDGDTLAGVLYADAGLGLEVAFGVQGHPSTYWRVRLAGINAPELSSADGQEAKRFVEAQVSPGDQVAVDSVGWDKYGRRIDGVVVTTTGVDLASAVLAAGHAVRRVY